MPLPNFVTRSEFLQWRARVERLIGAGGSSSSSSSHSHTPSSIGAAADSDVVKLAGTQTVTGSKAFSQPVGIAKQGSTPSTPSSGSALIYPKSDGLPYWLDDTGAERPLIDVIPALHAGPDFETWDTDAKEGYGTPASTPFPVGWSAYWMGAGVTVTQSPDRVSGASSIRMDVPAGANPRVLSETVLDVQPGDIVTVSTYAKCSIANTKLGITLLTAASGTPDYFSPGTTDTNRDVRMATTWRRHEVSHVVPAGHTVARISLAGDGAAAMTYYLDNTGSTLRTPSEGTVLTGSITIWPLAAAPAGYVLCDGATYNTVDYPNLAALLGASGSTFSVPDLRDRFPIGVSGTKAIGTTGGAATKTLVAANLPPHAHDMTHTHTVARGTAVGTSASTAAQGNNTAPGTTMSTGAASASSTGNGPGTSTALDVMNPWRAVNFIIKT